MKLTKEIIIQKYITENLSLNETLEFFNCSEWEFRKARIKYGIHKDKKEAAKVAARLCLEKYGVNNVFQLNQVKDKIKSTKLDRYGDENYMNKDKMMQTSLERYGSTCSLNNPEIRAKAKTTFIEHFGTTSNLNNETQKDIIKQTNILKYGYEKATKNETVKEKIKKTLSIKYIEAQHTYSEDDMIYIDEIKNIFPNSFIEKEYMKLYNSNKNLCIDFSDILDNTRYREKEVFVFHIFKHEWANDRKKNIIISMINNLLGFNYTKIYARKCEIVELNNNDSCDFLHTNHLQSKDASSIRLGLIFNGELVSVMTFCKPRFNKNYQYELSRFANKLGTSVIGGASKLLKYFIEKYSPDSILSYSNIAKTKGNLYDMLGFRCKGVSKSNYIWINNEGDMINRYHSQRHLLMEVEGSESSIMSNRGYWKLYDCGNKIWEWKK